MKRVLRGLESFEIFTKALQPSPRSVIHAPPPPKKNLCWSEQQAQSLNVRYIRTSRPIFRYLFVFFGLKSPPLLELLQRSHLCCLKNKTTQKANKPVSGVRLNVGISTNATMRVPPPASPNLISFPLQIKPDTHARLT